jgi:hypothetical protein
MHQIFAQGVEGFEQRRCETSRRAQSRPRRDIGHAGNLKISFLYTRQLERFPDDRMFDFLDTAYFFEMGILQQKTFYKPAMNSDVHVLVDCRGY